MIWIPKNDNVDDEGEQGPRMLRGVPRLPLPEPFLSFHKHPNSHHDEKDFGDKRS